MWKLKRKLEYLKRKYLWLFMSELLPAGSIFPWGTFVLTLAVRYYQLFYRHSGILCMCGS